MGKVKKQLNISEEFMKHKLKKIRLPALFVSIALLLGLSSGAGPAEEAMPNIRIGLYWGDNTLEGANLLNYVGSGYEFGYFDGDRQFVPLYATEETAISMIKDWTLYYTGGQYVSKPSGYDETRVGCYHIRLAVCKDLEEAEAVAGQYEDGYVAWMNESWCAFCGNYASQAAAEEASAARGIYGTAMTASSRCVTVVVTGTDRVIFQYDGGTDSTLGVMPLPSEEGEKPITWFRGHRYYGGFQYSRLDGGDLTVVNFIDMDDYVTGVVPYEMSPGWPAEALKAQAVAARTYAAKHLGHHSAYGFDLCTGVDCQTYRGVDVDAPECEAAVHETDGIYMTYEGEYADTYYHSCDGGATEASENVFYEAIPYLRGTVDPYEASVVTGYEDWSFVYTADEITWILQNKGYNCARIVSITPTYTELGNIYSLKFTDVNGVSWTFSRSRAGSILVSPTLGKSTYSQRFTVTDADAGDSTVYINNAAGAISKEQVLYAVDSSGQLQPVGGEGSVTVITGSGVENLSLSGSGAVISAQRYLISGSGWGHNVGLSQFGAKAMAEQGFSYEEILDFYFHGAEIG